MQQQRHADELPERGGSLPDRLGLWHVGGRCRPPAAVTPSPSGPSARLIGLWQRLTAASPSLPGGGARGTVGAAQPEAQRAMTIDPEATGEVLLTVTPAETAAR